MAAQQCFDADADDLITTSGAQQANELSCKVLLNRGDTLFCEAPSFIGSLNAFRSYGVDLVGIPMEQDGMDLAAMEEAVKASKSPKLVYVIPNFQNPTGRVMSLEKRKGLYELACKYDFIILEDNPYGDLRFAGSDVPSIKSMDTEHRVIYSGTFSKILAPGLRVGYVSAPKEIIAKITVCKQVADVHTNIWAQAVCAEFLERTDMDTYLEKTACGIPPEVRPHGRRHSPSLLRQGTVGNAAGRSVPVVHPAGRLRHAGVLHQGSTGVLHCRCPRKRLSGGRNRPDHVVPPELLHAV